MKLLLEKLNYFQLTKFQVLFFYTYFFPLKIQLSALKVNIIVKTMTEYKNNHLLVH